MKMLNYSMKEKIRVFSTKNYFSKLIEGKRKENKKSPSPI